MIYFHRLLCIMHVAEWFHPPLLPSHLYQMKEASFQYLFLLLDKPKIMNVCLCGWRVSQIIYIFHCSAVVRRQYIQIKFHIFKKILNKVRKLFEVWLKIDPFVQNALPRTQESKVDGIYVNRSHFTGCKDTLNSDCVIFSSNEIDHLL